MNTQTQSFLNLNMTRLKALYQRFGRPGLKNCPPADVQLLLAAKRLELNELFNRIGGQGFGERDAALKHGMQLIIKDLSGLLKERTATLSQAQQQNRGSGSVEWSDRRRASPGFSEEDMGYELLLAVIPALISAGVVGLICWKLEGLTLRVRMKSRRKQRRKPLAYWEDVRPPASTLPPSTWESSAPAWPATRAGGKRGLQH